MNGAILLSLVLSAITTGTPLLLAGLGELLAERSGVLNLGVEGMMLMGAVTAFFVSQSVGGPEWFSLIVALLAAALVGGLLALIHAFLAITARVNQIVSGLALTIFAGAVGLSSFAATVWRIGGQHGEHQFTKIDVMGLSTVPTIGPIFFHQDAMVYLSWLLVVVACWYLYRTRAGLHLRAVGESPRSADAMGIDVIRCRYIHTVIGGMLAGLGGAYFTMALLPTWTDGLTSGAGWIALALVIFAFWRPELLVVGAYLFGAMSSLGFVLQTIGVRLPPEFLNILPYAMTVIVLAVASTTLANRRIGSPAALGVPYAREEG